jgi:hypothetical protein
MAEQKRYNVYFIYDVHDHALKFPLQAEVEHNADGSYTVTNIRLRSEKEGSLLPPVQLKKINGVWIFADNGKESNLSKSIGMEIDEHEQG